MTERFKLLLTNAMHPDGEALLVSEADLVTAPDAHADTLRELAADVDGIVVRAKLPDDILDHAPRLKGIVRHGVGLDFIPVEAATARGVPVANLPGSNTQAVAEYCIGAMIELRRGLATMNGAMRANGWLAARGLADNKLELRGATLGIVGVGTIGSRVAEIAHRGFGMQILGTSRRPETLPLGVDHAPLDKVFGESDVVLISCALTEDTRGMVNERLIRSMRQGSVLINVSRGAVIETSAVVRALKSGHLGGAALDVFERQPLDPTDELFDCPNLILTPHVAGITATSLRNMSVGAAEEMLRILHGETPQNLVNPSFRTV